MKSALVAVWTLVTTALVVSCIVLVQREPKQGLIICRSDGSLLISNIRIETKNSAIEPLINISPNLCE